MTVGSVLIGLQATRKGGYGVTAAEFLAPLSIQPGEVEATRADTGAWGSAMIYFAIVRHSDFAHVDTTEDAGAQTEAFFAAIQDAFRFTGRFLDQRIPEITARMRSVGLSLRLFVEVRMNQDQMELHLPPEFVSACGRHALGIYTISNDIPASKVWAANQR